MRVKNQLGQFDLVDPILRFNEKVEKLKHCWIWTGWKDGNGYGRLRIGSSNVPSHKFSYESKFGKVPEKYVIDHVCRTRACVNPDHLEAVTRAENNYRGISPSAIHRRMKVCRNGHDFDRLRPANRRACSKCKKAYNLAYREKNRQSLREYDRRRYRNKLEKLGK